MRANYPVPDAKALTEACRSSGICWKTFQVCPNSLKTSCATPSKMHPLSVCRFCYSLNLFFSSPFLFLRKAMIGSWSWTFTNLKLKRICITLSKVNLVAGSVSLVITRFTAGDKRKQVPHWYHGFICFSRRWRGRSLRFSFISSGQSTLTKKKSKTMANYWGTCK